MNEDGEVAGGTTDAAFDQVAGAEANAVLAGDGRPRVRRIGDGPTIVVTAVDWSVLGPLADAMRAGQPVALATVVEGPVPGASMVVGRHGTLAGGLGNPRLDSVVMSDALAALVHDRTFVLRIGADGRRAGRDLAVFVQSFRRPRPRHDPVTDPTASPVTARFRDF